MLLYRGRNSLSIEILAAPIAAYGRLVSVAFNPVHARVGKVGPIDREEPPGRSRDRDNGQVQRCCDHSNDEHIHALVPQIWICSI
jgi:hypothetical protein